MSRQRRRRVQDSNLMEEATEYREEKENKKNNKSQVVFMEQMDYKMEI